MTFETLAKQEIQHVICDLPDQIGGFERQKSKVIVCIQYINYLRSDNVLMYPRTSIRNGCCSDQRSFHQLLKAMGENSLEWRAKVRNEHLGETKRLKKLFEQKKMR